jgi:hypothetical protein
MTHHLYRSLIGTLLCLSSFVCSAGTKYGFDLGYRYEDSYSYRTGTVGNRYIYVKAIDIQGPAAAGQLGFNDQIIAIDDIPVKYLSMADAIIKKHDASKPLKLFIQSNNRLKLVKIYASGKNEKFSSMRFSKTNNADVDCYLAPTIDCIKQHVTRPKPSEFMLRVYRRYPVAFLRNIETLELLGKAGLIPEKDKYSEYLQTLFLKIQKNNDARYFLFQRLIHALSILGSKPKPEVMQTIFQNLNLNNNSHLTSVRALLKHGYIKEAIPLVEKITSDIEKGKLKKVIYQSNKNAVYFADLYSYPKTFAYLKRLVASKALSDEHIWKMNFYNRVAENFFYQGNYEIGLLFLDEAIGFTKNYYNDSANYISLAQNIRFIYKKDRIAKLLANLQGWLNSKNVKNKPIWKKNIAISLAEIYGLTGNLQIGRLIINENITDKKQRDKAYMSLAIAVSKSMPAASVSIISNKELQGLLDEIYNNYRKNLKHNKIDYPPSDEVVQFIGLMAAYKHKEFTPGNYPELASSISTKHHFYIVDNILYQLMQTGQTQALLEWVGYIDKEIEKNEKNEKTYTRSLKQSYNALFKDVFTYLGQSVSDNELKKLSKLHIFNNQLSEYMMDTRLRTSYLTADKNLVLKILKTHKIDNLDVQQQLVYTSNACKECRY